LSHLDIVSACVELNANSVKILPKQLRNVFELIEAGKITCKN